MTITMDSGASGTSNPYITPAQCLRYLDVRWVADLVTDLGVKVGSSTDTAAMATALTNNVNFLELLDAACGELEARALVGQRYRQTDLATIAASSTVAAAKMRRMLAHIAACFLWERRPVKELPEAYEGVMDELLALEEGKAIFGTVEHEKAGQVSSRVESRWDVDRRNLMVTRAAAFFGSRGDRGPYAAGGPIP